MNKKQFIAAFLITCFTGIVAIGQTTNSTTDLIMKHYGVRNYTSEQVSDSDLELILKCGIKAPSASNKQPWKFIAVKNLDLMKQMMANVTPGNVLIVICGPEAQDGLSVNFDCGLAMENMDIAAQSLGLGTRIYGSPIRNINLSMKQALKIPDDYRAIMVLRVGHVEKGVDATSAASARNSYNDVVTILK